MKTKEQLVSLGLTDKKAEEIMKLEKRMLTEAIKFQYRKKDGRLRDARGTLDPEKMIQDNGEKWTPKGEPKEESKTNVKYWDLAQRAWREFVCTNFVMAEV